MHVLSEDAANIVEYVPSLHAVHALALVGAETFGEPHLPLGQGVQAVAPTFWLKVPGGQS